MMNSRICTAFLLSMFLVGSAHAQGLRMYDVTGSPNFLDFVWSVDPATPAATNPVEMDIGNAIAGFEYGNGLYYAANTNTNTDLFVLNPGTGSLVNTLTMTFPGGGDVITSLEFANGILYGGFTTEGGGPSNLVSINTNTGNTTLIGAMGIGAPTGGLAFDGTTMYTVNSGAGGSATLYTVDLGSGSASAVAAILDGSGNSVTLTGLEFGRDGVLYGLGRAGNEDDLFAIDPITGLATNLGNLGPFSGQTTTLTSIPEPTSLFLLSAAGFFGLARRRRK